MICCLNTLLISVDCQIYYNKYFPNHFIKIYFCIFIFYLTLKTNGINTKYVSLGIRCVPLSGISDHGIVLEDSSVLSARKKPVRRKIYLWKRANEPAMDEELTKFTQKLIEDNTTSTPVDTLWNRFKENALKVSTPTILPS